MVDEKCTYFTLFSAFKQSQAKTAQGILDRLQDGSTDHQIEALQSLSEFSNDVTVAQDFIDKGGLQIIIKMVEAGTQ